MTYTIDCFRLGAVPKLLLVFPYTANPKPYHCISIYIGTHSSCFCERFLQQRVSDSPEPFNPSAGARVESLGLEVRAIARRDEVLGFFKPLSHGLIVRSS